MGKFNLLSLKLLCDPWARFSNLLGNRIEFQTNRLELKSFHEMLLQYYLWRPFRWRWWGRLWLARWFIHWCWSLIKWVVKRQVVYLRLTKRWEVWGSADSPNGSGVLLLWLSEAMHIQHVYLRRNSGRNLDRPVSM